MTTTTGKIVCEIRFVRFFIFMLLAPSLLIACANLRSCLTFAHLADLLLPFIWELLCLALFLLCFAISKTWLRRTAMAAAGVAAGLFNSADLLLFLNSRSQLSPSLLLQSEEVNYAELSGVFLIYLVNWINVLIPVYWAVGAGLLFTKKPRHAGRALLAVSLALVALTGFSGAIRPAAESGAPALKSIPDMALEYLDECIPGETIRNGLARSNADIKAVNDEKQAVYVLVIGESHSKRHSSLYGYPRKNMPEMEKLRDDGELFVFNDVVSPNSFTRYVVPRLLSFSAHDAWESFYETQNLIDIMAAAGFKTFWLGNQIPYDSQDVQGRSLSERANVRRVPFTSQTDSCLLPFLEDALDDPAPKKFIILHLWGSHFEYSDCYPPERALYKLDEEPDFFNPEQKKRKAEINAYDNSVLFTDFILSKAVSSLKKKGGNSFMLYLSDHGENLYELPSVATHMDFLPTVYSVEIPMFVWLSESFKLSRSKEVSSSIAAAVDKPLCSEDSIHAFLELSNVATPKFDPAKSVVNPAFAPKRRIVSNDGVFYDDLKSAPVKDVLSGRLSH